MLAYTSQSACCTWLVSREQSLHGRERGREGWMEGGREGRHSTKPCVEKNTASSFFAKEKRQKTLQRQRHDPVQTTGSHKKTDCLQGVSTRVFPSAVANQRACKTPHAHTRSHCAGPFACAAGGGGGFVYGLIPPPIWADEIHIAPADRYIHTAVARGVQRAAVCACWCAGVSQFYPY